MNTKPRPRKCATCREAFTPQRMGQKACSPSCAISLATSSRLKKERREDKAKADAMKGIPALKKEAQQAFNAFIRERDRMAGHPCICCGQPLRWGELGGAVDAGHYRSTGSADHLRFNEDNCHAQLAQCNRYGAGRAVNYRLGLVARIGQARVEALETNNEVHKWTREELRQIAATYRAKTRSLKASRQVLDPANGAQLGACIV